MQLINITTIAVALAMDAFAVAIAAGITLKTVSFRQNFRLAWHFGLFQAMMPVLGWSAGYFVHDMIEKYDHWIAFALLAFVAQGMLRNAFKGEKEEDVKDPTKGAIMVLLSFATSIDALAVGLSLSMIKVTIWKPAIIIGIVACIFTTIGMHIGRKIGNAKYLSRYAEAFGGILLFLIGLNILREHDALNLLFQLTH